MDRKHEFPQISFQHLYPEFLATENFIEEHFKMNNNLELLARISKSYKNKELVCKLTSPRDLVLKITSLKIIFKK